MDDEKRGDEGVRLRRFIEIVVEDKASFTLFRAAVADLSITGMRIVSEQYLPKGSVYTFTMKRTPFLMVRGAVRWIRAYEGDTFHCGIQFAELADDDRRRLQSFLDIERQRVPTSPS
jgi:c-di-GMP-binding flagellar brake protein YcgR